MNRHGDPSADGMFDPRLLQGINQTDEFCVEIHPVSLVTSPIYLAHHHINTPDNRRHVGDQAAFA